MQVAGGVLEAEASLPLPCISPFLCPSTGPRAWRRQCWPGPPSLRVTASQQEKDDPGGPSPQAPAQELNSQGSE